MLRRHALLAAAALSLGALIAGPAGGAVAAGTEPSTSVVVLTAQDNGRTVTVHPGDFVNVALPPEPSGSVIWVWSAPTSSNPSVLAPLSGLPNAPSTNNAAFRAGGTGSSVLSARKGCQVMSSDAVCPMVLILWSVRVDVR